MKAYHRTDAQVEQNVKEIIENGMKQVDQAKAYRFILSAIDLTTLSGTDRPQVITDLCKKATKFENSKLNTKNVAAVCVYPPFVHQCKTLLQNTNINVASVAGAFPSGQSPLAIKVEEVKYAIDAGADEIDMVISRGKFLDGDFEQVELEIATIKKACGKAHLKVILETGELATAGNIWRASHLAIQNGADFIKTSTGKIEPAATLEAFYVMLDAIKIHHKSTGVKIGIKPAGGISDSETALKYYIVLEHVLGEEWIDNTLFRFGASRLADDVYRKITKLKSN